MYSINNANLYEDEGRADLPLDQPRKRRYNLNLESSGFTTNMVANKTFQTYTATDTKFRASSTCALEFNLPMPLQSRSGFFNVSLRSMAIGQNTVNTLHNFDPPAFSSDISYTPLTSNLTVNLANASSPYNLHIKDNGTDFEAFNFVVAPGDPDVSVISSSQSSKSITRMEQIAGAITPIGTCHTNCTNSADHVTEPPVYSHFMNAPFSYATRCDDYTTTLPDSTFQSGKISVVLTSCANVLVYDGVQYPGVLRTNVPLMVNTTKQSQELTASYDNYTPFNLPYQMVLSLEEA
jgi:hypothetical protein